MSPPQMLQRPHLPNNTTTIVYNYSPVNHPPPGTIIMTSLPGGNPSGIRVVGDIHHILDKHVRGDASREYYQWIYIVPAREDIGPRIMTTYEGFTSPFRVRQIWLPPLYPSYMRKRYFPLLPLLVSDVRYVISSPDDESYSSRVRMSNL